MQGTYLARRVAALTTLAVLAFAAPAAADAASFTAVEDASTTSSQPTSNGGRGSEDELWTESSGYSCMSPRWEANFNAVLPSNIQAAPGRVTRETVPAPFEGSHYGRFQVNDGDNVAGGERAEARTGSDFFANGEESWIRQRVRIPDSTATQSGWRIIGQVHTGPGSPAIATFLDGTGSDLRFRIGHGDSSRVDWSSPTIARNEWYDITIHWRSASAANGGFVEVYFGQPGSAPTIQTLTGGVTRRAVTTRTQDGGGENYWKSGLYRSSAISQTDVVHQDGVCIASSQADVGL